VQYIFILKNLTLTNWILTYQMQLLLCQLFYFAPLAPLLSVTLLKVMRLSFILLLRGKFCLNNTYKAPAAEVYLRSQFLP